MLLFFPLNSPTLFSRLDLVVTTTIASQALEPVRNDGRESDRWRESYRRRRLVRRISERDCANVLTRVPRVDSHLGEQCRHVDSVRHEEVEERE